MLACLTLLLSLAAGLETPTVIRPGTPEENAYLVDDHSALREIGYDPLCPFTRIADGTSMAYTYRFEPGRGRRAWLLIGVGSQFLITARAEGQTDWQRVADMDQASYVGTRVLVDLTPFAAEADAVLVRFEDKHKDDGWGALTSEILYYHDDQPGPLWLDVPIGGRVIVPASWAGQQLAVHLPRAASSARLNGRALDLSHTYDGGWWADVTHLLPPGVQTIEANVAARVGLRLPACAVPPSARPNRAFAPYRPEAMDALAGNYLQCLLDDRYNLSAFTAAERQPIHFVHDTLRALSALAVEAERTGVCRPELASRLYRGCRAAILPGGEDLLAFKHDERPLDIRPLADSTDLTLVHKLDTARTVAAVGASGATVRTTVPPGDSDRPPRFEFTPAGPTTVRVGRLAANGMWFQPGSWGPEALMLPDGSVQWAHEAEPKADPAAPYLLLRGGNTGQQTFCRALLVAWDRAPERIRFTLKPGGRHGRLIDQVLLDYTGTQPVGLVVYPFAGQTERLATARAIAENIGRTGRLGSGIYDPVETTNGCGLGVEGIAAAAWLMRRHQRPEAAEAEALAQRLMKSTTDQDLAGTHSAELYNLIEAPRYLAELGHREWLPWLTVWGERILAMQQPDGSYPWLDQQLRMMSALLKLADSTGEPRYRAAYDRALATVGYREGRLVWKGVPQEAGDFVGALTTAIYGRTGRLDRVREALAARSAYIDDRGYQACSDLNPYMLGFAAGLSKPAAKPLVLDLTHFAGPGADGPHEVDWPTAYVVNPHHPFAAAVRFELPGAR